MNKATARLEKEFLEQLKDSPHIGGFSGVSARGFTWRFRVLGRGESAFFQLGDRAMYIDIDARIGSVSRKSIRCWDDETIATDDESEAILEAVRQAFRELGFSETIVD